MVQAHVTRLTPLPFEMELVDGTTVATIGDVEKYMAGLSPDRRERSHWSIAIRMVGHALNEPAYLKATTLSFQTALVLDGLVVRMQG
jgi:hypothetical protein